MRTNLRSERVVKVDGILGFVEDVGEGLVGAEELLHGFRSGNTDLLDNFPGAGKTGISFRKCSQDVVLSEHILIDNLHLSSTSKQNKVIA